MLEFQNCVFRQGDFELQANWTVPASTRLAVVGPSGAGKSTLLGGVAGFTELASGNLSWNGVTLPSDPAKRPVSMLFQDHNLFPHLSVAQNTGLGLRPSLRLTAEETAKVKAALAAVGLEGLDKRKPAELSGGQQSRAAIARVLVMGRPIMLLDEPFSALGPAQRKEMLDLVTSVAQTNSALLIMVTHDPDEAHRLGGDVCFVENGVASVPMRADDFFANPPEGMRRYSGG